MPRKIALCIGLNYASYGQLQLFGCINDANNIAAFLRNNLKFDQIVVRTDQDKVAGVRSWGTANDIVQALTLFVGQLQDGDFGFVSFSGHGLCSKATDDAGETDGMNEYILCTDCKTIKDDDLKKMLTANLNTNATLFCAFDCCQSGSVMDLRYQLKENSGTNYNSNTYYPATKASVLCLAGCRDSQGSADAFIDNVKCGALSWGLVKALQAQPKTYADMYSLISANLKSKNFPQIPQLSFGKFTDIGLKPFWL